MRKTKIIATLGPASASYAKIAGLLKAGVNVFRLNFSHGSTAFFRSLIMNIRKASEKTGLPAAIMQDLQGPKIRVAGLKQAISVKRGEALEIKSQKLKVKSEDGKKVISIDYKNLHLHIKPGQKILINDGMVQLKVSAIKVSSVICAVTAGGEIAPRKGVNIPGVKLSVASLTKADRKNLKFGLKENADIVCLSFVRDEKDVLELKKAAGRAKNRPLLIAKIEKPEALKRLGPIIASCDGIMAARGDLAVEAGYRAVPAAQKKMIKMANDRGKLVIVATQMLESMISNPFPQRAEITDVYNAVSDGADLLMLSAETSMGKYPEKTVRTMAGIISEAEKKERNGSCAISRVTKGHELENAVSAAAVEAACVLKKASIAVMVRKKEDIRYLSDYRPKNGIIAVVENKAMLGKMCAYHGVKPVLAAPGKAAETVKKSLKNAENTVFVDYESAAGAGITVKTSRS